MSQRITRLVVGVTILAAGCLAAGCAQGSNVGTALPSLSPSRNLSVSPPSFSPRTRAPNPTTAPPTVQPTTARVIAPVPAPSAHASAVASPSPAATGSGVPYPWVWIVLGVFVIAAVAALIARHYGRRSARTATWHSRMVDAYAKGSALYDMISMAEAPGALASDEASARWNDIRRRGDDLIQELYVLHDTAPGEAERARVADVLASLQAVRTALEAQHTPGGADPQQGARVHALLLSFGASLQVLRSPDQYAP
jgi:hypothetical protein